MNAPNAVMPSGDKVALVFVCACCGKPQRVEVKQSEYHAWLVERRHVQDAFPTLPASQRELFISGTCGDCFAEMFPPEPDDDGEDEDCEDDDLPQG